MPAFQKKFTFSKKIFVSKFFFSLCRGCNAGGGVVGAGHIHDNIIHMCLVRGGNANAACMQLSRGSNTKTFCKGEELQTDRPGELVACMHVKVVKHTHN